MYETRNISHRNFGYKIVMQKIIGITGEARSGKDTVGGFLLSLHGGYLYSFATPIRAMLEPLGVDLRDPYWQAHKDLPITSLGVSPRRMMQTLGTEWGRQLIHPDLWVYMAEKKFQETGDGMIVTDVRFENEANFVRKNGGVLIHVVRPNNEKVESHISEAGVAIVGGTDIIINNNGTLDELYHATKKVFNGPKT